MQTGSDAWHTEVTDPCVYLWYQAAMFSTRSCLFLRHRLFFRLVLVDIGYMRVNAVWWTLGMCALNAVWWTLGICALNAGSSRTPLSFHSNNLQDYSSWPFSTCWHRSAKHHRFYVLLFALYFDIIRRSLAVYWAATLNTNQTLLLAKPELAKVCSVWCKCSYRRVSVGLWREKVRLCRFRTDRHGDE